MGLRIVAVDLQNEAISKAWLELLDHYACDPMGGGAGLSAYARQHLVDELKSLPTFHSALAFAGDEAVGLINCFAGFSTFAARPLLNIHDINFAAERRINHANVLFTEDQIALARKLFMCLNANMNIQITFAATTNRFSMIFQSDRRSIINTSRNLDLDRLLMTLGTTAFTAGTDDFRHLALTAAGFTGHGLLNLPEHCIHQANLLAGTFASFAGFHTVAWLHRATMTMRAFIIER